jgi:hypothetical protein
VPDKEAKMTTGFNLKSQEKKALQEAVDKAIREIQSLDEKPQPEFLFDKETTGIARVAISIVKYAMRDFEGLRQQAKSVSDEFVGVLGSIQESLKKSDNNDYKPEFLTKLAKLEEIRSRWVSVRRSQAYRIGVAIHLLRPFVEHEKIRTTLAKDWEIGRTHEFLLDLFLPPDRAEETSTALQDTCENKWEKRYSPRKVALLCFVQTISAIYAYHAGRIFKNGGLFWVIAELKKAFAKL